MQKELQAYVFFNEMEDTHESTNLRKLADVWMSKNRCCQGHRNRSAVSVTRITVDIGRPSQEEEEVNPHSFRSQSPGRAVQAGIRGKRLREESSMGLAISFMKKKLLSYLNIKQYVTWGKLQLCNFSRQLPEKYSCNSYFLKLVTQFSNDIDNLTLTSTTLLTKKWH